MSTRKVGNKYIPFLRDGGGVGIGGWSGGHFHPKAHGGNAACAPRAMLEVFVNSEGRHTCKCYFGLMSVVNNHKHFLLIFVGQTNTYMRFVSEILAQLTTVNHPSWVQNHGSNLLLLLFTSYRSCCVYSLYNVLYMPPSGASSYPGYFGKPHWISMGLPEISRVTLKVMLQYAINAICIKTFLVLKPEYSGITRSMP